MDPLSALSGVLAVLGSAISTLQFAKNLRDAPKEVVLLLNDASNLRMLLENLEAVASTSPTHAFEPYTDFLSNLFQTAESNLSEVELVVTTRLTRRKSVADARSRPPILGSLRAITRLRELHTSLTSIKSSLTVILGVIAASESARTSKALDQLLSSQVIDQRHEMMRDILNKIQHLADHLLVTPTPTANPGDSAVINNISIQNTVINETQERRHTGSLWSSTETKTRSSSYVTEEAIVDVDEEEEPVPDSDEEVPIIKSCLKSCRCRCHTLRRMSTPAALSLAFGSLNLEYVAAPFITGSCNRRDCIRQSDCHVRVSYFFPPWLLLRTFLATIVVPQMQGVRMDLQAPRPVPTTSQVFEYARVGNVKGLKQLFDGGKASPFDVDTTTGSTALTYAIDQHRIETWRFLLKAGADPFQMNMAHQSAIDNAINKLMANVVGPEFAAAVRSDFDTQEYLQDREFSGLHMSVLGFINMPLRTQIDILPDKINERDWQGRTALSWASSRGDEDAVAMLLNCNADPNITAKNKSSPLQFASRASNPGCVKLLVDAGADINHRNIWQVDALSYAIRADDLVERIAPMVDGGAELTRTDDDNPLFLAAKHNHPKQAAYLLSKGATFPRQADCDLSINIAVEKKHSEVVQILLEHLKTSSTAFGVVAIRKHAMKLGDKDMIKLITSVLHSR